LREKRDSILSLKLTGDPQSYIYRITSHTPVPNTNSRHESFSVYCPSYMCYW